MAVDLLNADAIPLEILRDTEIILDVRFDENLQAVNNNY